MGRKTHFCRLTQNILIATLICAVLGEAFGQDLTPEEQKELDAMKPAATIILENNDSLNLRVAKAAKCLPDQRQIDWQQLEFTCFIHFGINTFS